jgi:eukaryotic-like serine/threonine-protein kinase
MPRGRHEIDEARMYEGRRVLAGRYRLDERIGAGGMGAVWRATDTVLGRTVAVKLMLATLLDEPDFERRFLFEARAMASLRHPGVVAIHDYRSDAEGAFLVMEYVEGEALSMTLRRYGRLSPVDTMHLVAQAADALAAAHAQGIVHRDVKPANLLLRPDGTLVLTDFGIARTGGATSITTPGEVLGTPSYLAPEQVIGQPATPRSDIYSLGVVAYECLAGRRPFDADNPYGSAMRRLHEPPPPLGPDVPPAVARVVAAALARDPADRWQSATDLGLAARAAAESTGSNATTVDVRPPLVRSVATETVSRRVVDGATDRRRRRLWAVAAVAAVLTLIAGGILATARGTLNRDATSSGPSSGATLPDAASDDPTAGGPGSTVAAPGGGSGLPGAAPGAFVTCGTVFCPAAPMCWHGLVVISGRGQPLSKADCARDHYWETYVAAPLPESAIDVRQDELMDDNPEVAAICSADRLAERSKDPAATTDWSREPWPLEVNGVWLLYCLAGGNDGETTGSAFRPGTA